MGKKLTTEMRYALSDYFNLMPSHPEFRNAKINFTKKWGMSPGYMATMYK